MPFIPHTKTDISEMLEAINIAEISQLFDEIPKDIPSTELKDIPEGMNELTASQLWIQLQMRNLK